jgi:hypothetical protein
LGIVNQVHLIVVPDVIQDVAHCHLFTNIGRSVSLDRREPIIRTFHPLAFLHQNVLTLGPLNGEVRRPSLDRPVIEQIRPENQEEMPVARQSVDRLPF